MKRYYKYGALILFIATVMFACREKYLPPAIDVNSNYLVVEGLINTGSDSTIIKLSRTVKLSNTTAVKGEAKATVTVESSGGTTYALPELSASPGTYAAAPLGLSSTQQYRLRIKTLAGKVYLSDYVKAYITPPIDSLYWQVDNQAVHIYANTHSAATNTRYYRYSFDETYQYNAQYPSYLIASGNSIVRRDMVNNNVFTCWRTLGSTNIVTNSSAKLTQNIINQGSVTDVDLGSIKLKNEYSILVKQYAISEDAYSFWTILKTNTESLGSIFDAQPTQLQGNIHNVSDAAEPVFGYIGAGTVQQKRIFIFRSDLPPLNGIDSRYCSLDSVYFVNPKTHANDVASTLYTKLEYPIDELTTASGTVVGYTASTPSCVDCTLLGGTNKKPIFWK